MSGETPVTPERPETDPARDGMEHPAGDPQAAGAQPSDVADAGGDQGEDGSATEPPVSPGIGDTTGPDAAADRVRELEARLESLSREHEALNSQYVRIAADFDNFRKRQQRDQEDQRLQLTCTTLAEILPVVDNFERARQQLDPQNEEAQGLHRSYQGLYKQLVDVLRKFGVSVMRVEGETFDPTLHEAVMREESDEHPEDVITAELQRGYQLNERVLRHALVKVSMGPGPAPDAPSTDAEEPAG
ncbi:nucleotide exchange factor GrpE [Synechococcus sp. RSCCF101]|uniref:nucleotide exchange factor GrpE n=1 Tax=Synechococcus sp. RSCCF101 TaxID=2511069 RepID=UPI001245D201|nr:nucleotide exchange factor GrpE [Synechococcus sp. RSCCF101]QEY32568.1 nucleotide exchange factor GrpE [Synechococcus sp. RSCCF101]